MCAYIRPWHTDPYGGVSVELPCLVTASHIPTLHACHGGATVTHFTQDYRRVRGHREELDILQQTMMAGDRERMHVVKMTQT